MCKQKDLEISRLQNSIKHMGDQFLDIFLVSIKHMDDQFLYIFLVSI